jgi:hypothetical protein
MVEARRAFVSMRKASDPDSLKTSRYAKIIGYKRTISSIRYGERMMTFDRETIIRQLRHLSTEKLAEILRRRDTSEWREEVFAIIERMLAERRTGHKRVAVATKAPSAITTPAPDAEPAHISTAAFEGAVSDALAVHCSDGRFTAHFNEFLATQLGLPRCHRLAVPGGPILLAGRLASYWEGAGVENQARFLIDANGLKRVILIAHEGCLYYSRKLGLTDADVLRTQRDDLVKAAQTLQRLGESLDVKTFVARIAENRILFEPVSL